MTLKRSRLFVVLLVAFALAAAACSSDDSTTETTAASGGTETTAAPAAGEVLKVAFVHVGPVSDKGWSWAHDQGAQFIKGELGDAVEITTLENIAEGSDSQREFENLAAAGNTLIFGTSF